MDEKFKVHSKFISQTIIKVLKNRGKYMKSPIFVNQEFNFFLDIKSVLENKYKCMVNVLNEKDSKECIHL